MADRSVAATSTMNDLRREFNGSARDIGEIADILSASSYIASSTDVIEAIVAINTEVPEVKTDAFTFPGRTMIFEGATDDDFETTLSFAEPTADRTHTLPDANGTISLTDNADTSTNKTFTTPTITSGVFNTGVSGSAVLDEDNMASDSATKLATQQSIKAYVDNQIDTDMDVNITSDSGSVAIVMDSETLTIAGGSNITTAATGNTVTVTLSSSVATTSGTETFTNKTFTSPTINTHTFSSGTSTSGMSIGANGIVFEGATADAHETTLTAADPSQDNTITIPNETMTAITTATHASKASHIVNCIALG
tara:strand:+ start:1011 stop:1940 length:930 start_codon:yes stop_codon:yes gene_type:complete